ncbi:helix-turn-helix transcriptional regulator [Jiangella alba]|uniref:Helix-turn-helix domain-containing protein n=1 Tax=Jiangella alba TaxID=561176 RepID=A0A1H5PYE4_9ACTN|nr:helix-turn-helix transcriptional regulator [Jiangella alba]SEF18755.1 Helix-turn-helix domain-containing protein [Jiangella alba]
MAREPADEGRSALAAFLTSRRGRVSPEEAGIAPGVRRRTPGLRREEVALLAGISPTWYTYLEQGRRIHPSQQVLDAIARVLRLSEDERRYMHVLAFGAVQNPQPLAGEIPAEEIVRQLVATAEHSPYPVYAADLFGDLIAWNRATADYYADFDAMPSEDRNMIRWLLFDPEARRRLPGWAADVPDIVGRWRAMVTAHSHVPGLLDQAAEFRRGSAEFAEAWDGYEVVERRTRTRTFLMPGGHVVVMRLIVVHAPEFEPSLVAFHVPV